MKSVKPGRGPSFMGGVGSLIAVGFGAIWMALAFSMGAPTLFCLFGVLFILMGLANVIYSFVNATGKKRFSVFDITEDGEEEDPLNERFGVKRETKAPDGETVYCPYCGEKAEQGYRYCRKCGKELP